MSSRALPLLLLALSPAAFAGRIPIAGATASSEYPDEAGVSYAASKAYDGKLATSWVEGDDGSGLGAWLELDLGGERAVTELRVYGGLWYSHDYWARANRPREIEVKWSDGTTDRFELADAMTVQSVKLPAPKKTTSVRLQIKAIHSGNTWLDTAISEVQVYDVDATDVVVVREASASSQLAADADGSYLPEHLFDGLSDSMWCEGSKAGDGTGEWIQLTLGSTRSVSEMELINGIGTSLPFWSKGNRAARATLTFSDGSTEQVTVKNTMLKQKIAFAPRSTSSVKVTFDEVVKGTEFNDLCVSELVLR